MSAILKENHNKTYKPQILWFNVLGIVAVHIFGLYAFYNPYQPILNLFVCSKIIFPFFFVFNIITVLGVNVGVHRMWSHRSYKARWPLRLLLMVCQTITIQGHIFFWVHTHRL